MHTICFFNFLLIFCDFHERFYYIHYNLDYWAWSPEVNY